MQTTDVNDVQLTESSEEKCVTERHKRRVKTSAWHTKRFSTNTNGELIEDGEKKLLDQTMENLRYEVYKRGPEKGRDFTGHFTLKNALRETFMHLIFFAFGQMSLIILYPWLGKAICQKKFFMFNKTLYHPSLTYLILSFTGPTIFLCLVSMYQFNYSLPHISWADFFLPIFLILVITSTAFIKYGLMDQRNYMKQNYNKLHLKKKLSGINETMSTKFSGPLSIFVGMIGSSSMREKALRREYRLQASNVLHFDSDEIVLPLGFKEREPGKAGSRYSIIHNPHNLQMKYDASKEIDDINFTTVKALHIGDSILSSCAFCNCNKEEAVCKECEKKKPYGITLFFYTQILGLIYFLVRAAVLLQSTKFQINKVNWVEWVILCSTTASSSRAVQAAMQCGFPFCDFRRRRYIENRLAMLIHQMHIKSHKSIRAWERLRFCLKEMGGPQYRLLQAYFVQMIIMCFLYFTTFGALIVLDTNKTVSIFMVLMLAMFGFSFEGLILVGIRTGSLTNRVIIHHSKEWLNIKSRLLTETHTIRVKLKALKMEGKTETSDYDSSHKWSLIESHENFISATDAIDNVVEKLRLEMLYGGIRLMSLRLTKLLSKSLLLLYLYQMYYFVMIVLRIYYTDDSGRFGQLVDL